MSDGLTTWVETDIPRLLALEQQAYQFPWTLGNFMDSFHGPHQGLVLRLDGEILGYAIYQVIVDEMHLLNLVVDPIHQGQGHGERILSRLVSLARGLGCRDFFLEVRSSNQRAAQLYTKQGFSNIARRRAYYPAEGGREDAIIMEKKL
jgi:ribosomal-protein-alanine N-acetyltransferase